MAGHWSTRREDGIELSTDPSRLDFDRTHAAVAASFWCEGIPRDAFRRALGHSLAFGLYLPGGEQCGFCRAMTDTAVFGYLTDVLVFDGQRGKGLGTWMLESVLRHPDMGRLRRTHLATRDRQALFGRLGFRLDAQPGMQMDILRTPAELWPTDG